MFSLSYRGPDHRLLQCCRHQLSLTGRLDGARKLGTCACVAVRCSCCWTRSAAAASHLYFLSFSLSLTSQENTKCGRCFSFFPLKTSTCILVSLLYFRRRGKSTGTWGDSRRRGYHLGTNCAVPHSLYSRKKEVKERWLETEKKRGRSSDSFSRRQAPLFV